MEKMCLCLKKIGRWFCKYWKTVLGVLFKVAIIIIGVFVAFVLAVLGNEEWDVRHQGLCQTVAWL